MVLSISRKKIVIAFAICTMMLCLKFAIFMKPNSSSGHIRAVRDVFCRNKFTGGSAAIQVDISNQCKQRLSCFVREMESVVVFLKFSKDSGRIIEDKIDLHFGDMHEYSSDLFSMSKFIIEKYIPETTITFKNVNINPSTTYMDCVDYKSFYNGFVPPVNMPKSLSCFGHLMNRKYDSNCMDKPQVTFPFLVTSSGGSGTHTVSNVLKTFNLDLKHEEIGLWGAISWPYAVNERFVKSSEYPHHAILPKSTFLSPRFETIIHLTRCPMKQISSLTSHLQTSFNFIRSFMIENTYNNEFYENRLKTIVSGGIGCKRGSKCNLHFVALAWLFWNDYISSYADKRFKIENVEDLIYFVCEKSEATKLNSDIKLIKNGSSSSSSSNKFNSSFSCANYMKLPSGRKKQYLNAILNVSTGVAFYNPSIPLLQNYVDGSSDERGIFQAYFLDRFAGKKKIKRSDFATASLAHRLHDSYTIRDISALDEVLAKRIDEKAIEYGYASADNC